MTRRILLALSLVTLTALPAHAIPFGFFKLTNNNDENLYGQLLVDVTANGTNQVDFKFTNNVGIASSITEIYFDDGTLLDLATVTNSSGVTFAENPPTNPDELPGGNTAVPPFVTTAGFSADIGPGNTSNGVNTAAESVIITFSLQAGQTFGDTITALNNGSLRIGLHVRAIGELGSGDSYINAVSEPAELATMFLMGLGLFGVGVWARRRLAHRTQTVITA